MYVYSTVEIGGLVRDARKSQGLTQKELAKECACGVRFISDLENGKPTVELGKVINVLNTLSVDVNLSRR